ncbi:TRAP transporter substrate-binding protein [Geoalkalibacter sp.]|uniref:TRAP transporter substrate-binding protein n=1 Tax=Geoalkalibacter sp. TaxID=3041440 RepID=UPI00272EA287|nr:TRAP transporter substrate-binding protein [Geoalkalibacter sp.]
MKKLSAAVLAVVMLALAPALAQAQDDPLAAWRPAFDPSGAKYTYILSNVSHPGIEGIGVGYRIRDKVWERSNGQLYVDFRPLAQLGGERDVLQKLRLGAVQGMLCSSVAAANLADQLGVVNLPYVVDTFDKLDKFRATPALWEPFRDSALRQGVMVTDITGYGPYGWATTTPVKTLADAGKVNFRIAEAPVNTDIYRAWGFKFTVMPWPDVPQALQTGVINGLDHTPIVCNLTKKFDIAKHFTQVNYAQGLFVHLMNKRWFDGLPPELQKVLIETIEEESAASRVATRRQQEEQIEAAKANGVTFYPLADEDREQLIKQAEPVLAKWGERIGADYLQTVRDTLGD